MLLWQGPKSNFFNKGLLCVNIEVQVVQSATCLGNSMIRTSKHESKTGSQSVPDSCILHYYGFVTKCYFYILFSWNSYVFMEM